MLASHKPRAYAAIAAGVLVLMALGGVLPVSAEEPPSFPALANDGEPLRAAFNRDAGRVRLLLFVDPT